MVIKLHICVTVDTFVRHDHFIYNKKKPVEPVNYNAYDVS